jgi:AraC-like DNA-binding protein
VTFDGEEHSAIAAWTFTVHSILQQTVSTLFHGSRHHLSAALTLLRDQLPAPATPHQSVSLRHILASFTSRAASSFHQYAHARAHTAMCEAISPPALTTMWTSGDAPLQILLDWQHQFTNWFDEHHPPSVACRAAARLDEACGTNVTIDGLARGIGTSRSTLTREFREEFGVSLHAFMARKRIMRGVMLLRGSAASIDAIAVEVGYQSANKFYAQVRRLTGLGPSQVRSLDDKIFEVRIAPALSPTPRSLFDACCPCRPERRCHQQCPISVATDSVVTTGLAPCR